MKSSQLISDNYKYGFHKPERYVYKARKGLTSDEIRKISAYKHEPAWMLEQRQKAFGIFQKKQLPVWGADLTTIDFNDIYYYLKPTNAIASRWNDLPPEILDTYNKIGIPEAEKKFLSGVSAQFESEVVYKSIQSALSKKGVIFLDMDSGLREHPDMVKQYFGTVIPAADNKFAALNTAVWSGGSFVYVPKGVHVELPLQAYFRINAANMGQFERTLIIAEEGSYVHYVEGCTAPIYTTDSLHSAVVEIIVKKGARVRYTTIQNWSTNVYNLVTKRARVEEEGTMEWIDGNLGCLTGDTYVLKQGGAEKLENISVGDVLLTVGKDLRMSYGKVLAKKVNPLRQTYKVTTDDYHEVIGTNNHPFLVLQKRGKIYALSWKPLSEIQIGDLVGIAGKIPVTGKPYEIQFNPSRGKKDFSFRTVTDDALLWLLGFYLGDGYLDRSRVYFSVPKSDKSHKRVIQTVRDWFHLTPEIRGVTIRYNSVKFVDFILSLGFKGSARTKTVPLWIYSLPTSQISAFIEGYIAADGYKRANHKNVSITSVNYNLLYQIKQLAYMTDWSPRKISRWTRKEKKPLGKECKTYTHYFLYFGDEKKREPVQFSKVMRITNQGFKKTYDIEVEGGNFIANGLLVHNSKITMKYPSVYLMGRKARGEVLSIAYAGAGQHQDAGGKAMHYAPETTSQIISKSISHGGGRTSYRGMVYVAPNAKHAKSKVVCDALILDEASRSDTYPTMKILVPQTQIEHEATVSKIGDEQLFYLMSRGLAKDMAQSMVVNGFIEPIVKELPLEYAVEMNRLIQLQMEGSVG